MAPRSPTHAFDPTPALEQNKDNYSPYTSPKAMLSAESSFPHSSKEVRFNDPPVHPIPRAHSIATSSVPLLPQIPSASQLPRQAFRITNPAPGIDINAYIENCRNLNEQLRIAHESERKAWDIERSALKAQIADLEFRLNKSRDLTRGSSSNAPPHALRAVPRSVLNGDAKVVQEPAPASSLSTPIWKGPEHQPPTARVFHNEDVNSNQLPMISEDNLSPSLSKQISPANNVPVVENVPVPIEKVEPTLDGITLKSAALTSSFVTKITSPQFGSPALVPSPKPRGEPSALAIDAHTLLAPLDEKLKRHAGHTPMNFEGGIASDVTSDQPSARSTPQAERPFAPVPTARPPLRPSENSNSYFSTVSAAVIHLDSQKPGAVPEEAEPEPVFEPEDDKPLKGPLMLDPKAKSEAASAFLSSVDAKLMAAVREVSPTRRESVLSENGEAVTLPVAALQANMDPAEPPQGNAAKKEYDDDMPRLKLKKSMNFGSAYGANLPGRW